MSLHGVSVCEDHDDCLVTYSGRTCPICRAEDERRSELAEHEKAIADLQDKIETMENP